MITSIELGNFKRFVRTSFKFERLTVLTGVNSGGKSSIIQAILLLRQACMGLDEGVVALNDSDGLGLGEAGDLLNFAATSSEMTVTATTDTDEACVALFAVPSDRGLYLTYRRSGPTPEGGLTGVGSAFTYLGADRLSPRDVYPTSPVEPARLNLGTRGEYAAQYLAEHERDEVPEGLRHPRTLEDAVPLTLLKQCEAWLSDLLRPVELDARWLAGLAAASLRYKAPGVETDWSRPRNIGFGFSTTLPIVVAGLSVKQGDVLIVDSPETHLHPSAQSRLGTFLSRVAGYGAQIVIETHSDHVLNGVRLGVRQGVLSSEAAVIQHLAEEVPSRSDGLKMTPGGGVTNWPPGFFDQMERDLAALTLPHAD